MIRQLLLFAAVPATVFALLLIVVGSAAAEEPVSTKEIQLWKKGAEIREIDLTSMGSAARKALDKQMRDLGFAPHELRVLKSYADGRIESAIRHYGKRDKKQPADPPAIDRGALDKDIREMLERGGRLPEGYVPHGSRPAPGVPDAAPVLPRMGHADAEARPGPLAPMLGKLLLRYLEVKRDPTRAPAYEAVLLELAEGLVALPERAIQDLAARALRRAREGVEDPQYAAAYQEILEHMTAVSPALPQQDAPKRSSPTLGGASLEPTTWLAIGGPGSAVPANGDPVLQVTAVPKGSLAARVGLLVGDRILRLGEEPPRPEALLAAQEILRKKGQLRLRVRRRNSDIVIEFGEH